MSKIVTVITFILFMSCGNSQPTHKLLYEFENNAQLSDADRSSVIEVLKKRLGKFSSDFDVTLTNDKKIEVTAKTSFNEHRLNTLMANQGKLEFWELYKNDELTSFLAEANQQQVKESQTDSLKPKALSDVISAMGYQHSPVLFFTEAKDTAFVNASFKKPNIRALLLNDKSDIKFIWGIPNDEGILPLYAAKSNREDKAFVSGEHITDARQGYDAIGRPTVAIQMDQLGSKRWERMTEIAFNQQTCIAITLNDLVYSAPGVTSGPIKGGNSEISGNFTLVEAQDLATILSASKRIPNIILIHSSVVDK